ncbi:MAG: RlmE family RNA methyltransferase [Proteobacteria bacterium]|nr:MAG: RlmE family RNA methyltransferase [Pseudomonadota bacterium]
MAFNPKDRFFHKAKAEGFAARSVYKLQEIDQKFKVLKPGQTVLDLGSSPGSWSQYAAQKIGNGRLLGVDLTKMNISLPNAVFIQADLRDLNLETVFREHGFHPPFDIVMSDMMANTTGIKSADQARSFELCELALTVAQRFLKPGGTFICKFFQSGEFGALRADIKRQYERVEALKPESTRAISKEIFLVGLKKKASAPVKPNPESSEPSESEEFGD